MTRFAATHTKTLQPLSILQCLPDLDDFRRMQQRYTRRIAAMPEKPAYSTFYLFAETIRPDAVSKNCGLMPVFRSSWQAGFKVVWIKRKRVSTILLVFVMRNQTKRIFYAIC